MQHSQMRVRGSQQKGRTVCKEIEVALELLLVACMHMDELRGGRIRSDFT